MSNKNRNYRRLRKEVQRSNPAEDYEDYDLKFSEDAEDYELEGYAFDGQSGFDEERTQSNAPSLNQFNVERWMADLEARSAQRIRMRERDLKRGILPGAGGEDFHQEQDAIEP